MSEKSVDPRVLRSRKLIEDALYNLWQERGWENITVRDITERAGVNRSTFYAHYTDKYDLLGHCIRNGFREALQAQLPDSACFCVDDIRALVQAAHDFVSQVHGGCHPTEKQLDLIMEAQVQTVLFEFLADWLETQQDTGIHQQTLAMTMSWTIFGAAMQMDGLNSGQNVDQITDEVVTVIQRIVQMSAATVG